MSPRPHPLPEQFASRARGRARTDGAATGQMGAQQVASFAQNGSGHSEDKAVSGTEKASGLVEKHAGADLYLLFLVLGEKQPPKQTSRLIKRKTKAKR